MKRARERFVMLGNGKEGYRGGGGGGMCYAPIVTGGLAGLLQWWANHLKGTNRPYGSQFGSLTVFKSLINTTLMLVPIQ